MDKNSLSIRKLLTHLQAQELVTQLDFVKVDGYLKAAEQETKDPLYIRILSGIGAWVAAIFVILFLGVSHIISAGTGAIVCGIIFLAGGIGIDRVSKGTFLNQLSLALVFSGNLSVLFGVGEGFRYFDDVSVFVITHAMICIIVYMLFPNTIYRFLAPTAFAVLLTAWIVQKKAFILIHFLIAAEMILAGVLLLSRKPRPLLRPLVYSTAFMLPAILLFLSLTQVEALEIGFKEPLWPSSIFLSIGLVFLYFYLSGDWKASPTPLLTLATISTVLLGIFTTPGILVAIGLMIIGYAFDDQILIGLSYLFLLCFLVLFYYALDVDLAHKSFVIAGSGVLLLLVRWIAGHYKPEDSSL